jgi:hypothetical protein
MNLLRQHVSLYYEFQQAQNISLMRLISPSRCRISHSYTNWFVHSMHYCYYNNFNNYINYLLNLNTKFDSYLTAFDA